MHEVLVNRLGGLSLPRISVVRLTDRPDMTLDVYRGRKTTQQQQILALCKSFAVFVIFALFCHFHFDFSRIHRFIARKFLFFLLSYSPFKVF